MKRMGRKKQECRVRETHPWTANLFREVHDAIVSFVIGCRDGVVQPKGESRMERYQAGAEVSPSPGKGDLNLPPPSRSTKKRREPDLNPKWRWTKMNKSQPTTLHDFQNCVGPRHHHSSSSGRFSSSIKFLPFQFTFSTF